MSDYPARREIMVDTQVRPADVTKFPIIDAMLSVPREDFVPSEQREAAYVGENLALDQDRVMLEPRTVAKMLDALNVTGTELVLVIGAGLGYTTALLARIAEAVVAVEDDAARASEAQTNLSDVGADNAIVHAGPLADGAAQHGPYDAILIEGGVEQVPDTLLDQLKEGGRIAALFVDGQLGIARIGYKIDGAISWRYAFNAAAPLLPGFVREQAFQL